MFWSALVGLVVFAYLCIHVRAKVPHSTPQKASRLISNGAFIDRDSSKDQLEDGFAGQDDFTFGKKSKRNRRHLVSATVGSARGFGSETGVVSEDRVEILRAVRAQRAERLTRRATTPSRKLLQKRNMRLTVFAANLAFSAPDPLIDARIRPGYGQFTRRERESASSSKTRRPKCAPGPTRCEPCQRTFKNAYSLTQVCVTVSHLLSGARISVTTSLLTSKHHASSHIAYSKWARLAVCQKLGVRPGKAYPADVQARDGVSLRFMSVYQCGCCGICSGMFCAALSMRAQDSPTSIKQGDTGGWCTSLTLRIS